MKHKRKVKRAFILIFSVYAIANIFIFGFMNAYVNTNNIVSKNQLVMASVTESNDETRLKILGKRFVIPKENTEKTIAEVCVYTLMTDKMRVCTDLILKIKSLIKLKSEQNVISSLNHVATIATVAGSLAPQGFSGRFFLLLKV